jgi:hypothetical protein
METHAHHWGGAADQLRLLPPLPQAGAGLRFRLAAIAVSPKPLGQPDSAQGSLGDHVAGKNMAGVLPHLEAQA